MLTIDRQIDRRILLEAESLASAGWEVTIVAPYARLERFGYPERQHPFKVRGVPPAPQRLVRSVYRLLRDTLPIGERGMRKLREIGWRFLFDQEKFYRDLFARSLDGLRPDVFIAHDLPTLPAAHKAAREAGARLIYDSHELYVEQELSEFEKRSWSAIERRYIGDCDAVVTVNPSIASELARRHALERIEVIYNAERRRLASGRSRYFHEKYGLPESARVLLMQGGLANGRNIETLVGAMELVGNPDIHLVIMGEGPLRGRLDAMAARSRSAERVHLHEGGRQEELLAHSRSRCRGDPLSGDLPEQLLLHAQQAVRVHRGRGRRPVERPAGNPAHRRWAADRSSSGPQPGGAGSRGNGSGVFRYCAPCAVAGQCGSRERRGELGRRGREVRGDCRARGCGTKATFGRKGLTYMSANASRTLRRGQISGSPPGLHRSVA
ncbi:glycosyltransferase [Mesorhizobium sp. KR2-14]|uniref:glycosyltransferase n=1 Tax=Mesorhizobium sp. KR2-14 TaxID=3156610 RepID=UPI0032B34393